MKSCCRDLARRRLYLPRDSRVKNMSTKMMTSRMISSIRTNSSKTMVKAVMSRSTMLMPMQSSSHKAFKMTVVREVHWLR